MSFFSKLIKGVVGAGAGFLAGGPLGAVVGGASAFIPKARAAAPAALPGGMGFVGGALPTLTPVRGARLPTIPRIPGPARNIPGLPIPLPDLDFGGAGAGAGGACPAGFHLDKRTRSRCVRNRRMNPLNGRAAMRAIRRIKGARKMLQKIERQLPKAKARRTPAHPHRVHVHTP